MSGPRRALLQVGLRAGVFGLARRALRRRHAVILTFHRFRGNGDGDRRGLDVERLEAYMQYLARHYRVVSLGQLVAELQRDAVRPFTAAVTVDDGYRDVLTLAAPVFRRHGVPACVFAVSDFVDGRLWPWTEQYRFVLDRAPAGPVEVEHRGSVHVVDVPAGDRLALAEHWLARAKRMALDERDELLGALAEACGIEVPVEPPPGSRPVGWQELRALAAEGFEVGAHTRTHPILSRLPAGALRAEIHACRERMEEALGRPVRFFAYPNGTGDDYTPVVLEAVRRAGYAAAVTAIPGGNLPSTPLFELRRIDGGVEDLAHFAQAVSGLEQAKERGRSVLVRCRPLAPAGSVTRSGATHA
jgi:peptidoglycan/xylan/chitin deacetylase (PgdA/CDA1 family)